MSPLGRTGTYGCVTRTRYKREKGGSAAIGGTLFRSSWHSPPALGAQDPAREREKREDGRREGGRLKKAAVRTEREKEAREGGERETRIVSAAK